MSSAGTLVGDVASIHIILGLGTPARACQVGGQVRGEPTCLVTNDVSGQPYLRGDQGARWIKHVEALRREAAAKGGLVTTVSRLRQPGRSVTYLRQHR